MNGGSGTGVVRIAVDAMGGDHAPLEIVKGAVLAATVACAEPSAGS